MLKVGIKLNLLNKNKVQSVILKLDKDKPRELRFREYLDSKVKEGMNRKEAILQLFENNVEQRPFNIDPAPAQQEEDKEEIKTIEQSQKVDESDFDLI